MTGDRDIAAFDARAGTYEGGWLGRLHRQIADRTAELALAVAPAPPRILDVGCGTGYLLRELAARCPHAVELVGVDPARRMIAAARAAAGAAAGDERLRWVEGTAEELAFPDGSFDLVVSTTSFDHWADQQAGLEGCARVLTPGGWLVVADLFSGWLAPTLVGSRRHKARTKRRASRLLAGTGFQDIRWHRVEGVVIRAVTARR
jgi:ubiquinone/menaquinone biosynthesis C-methylase UbiE